MLTTKQKRIPRSKKRIILILFTCLILGFTTGDNKSQYSIPMAAWSVTAGDIDMDGDNDIVVGHNYNSSSEWSGISYLINDGQGYFSLIDSIFLYSWQTNIYAINTDNDTLPEIIARHYENNIQYMAIVNFDQGSYVINLNNMAYGISGNNIGDINGDSFTDIIIYSSSNQFWGVMFNNSNGNFLEPEYYYLNDYSPSAIACKDLNNDNRDDIVICGQSTEVYFSYADGFQSMLLESGSYKEGVSLVDFDLDGDNDIITFVGVPIVGVTSLIMYENQGNNVFDTLPEFYFQPKSSRFFVTDFNNDSLQDILFQLSDKSGYIIYYNQGDFQLADSQFVSLPPSNPQEGWRNCYCADMDGNGYNDIITVKTLYVYLPDNLEILFNDGYGNFQEDPISEIQIPITKNENPIACYPNPFSNKLTIEINLNTITYESLEIYDINGSLIKTIACKNISPYVNKHIWNGKDENGKEVQPGLYLIRLNSGRKVYSQQVIKIK